MRLPILVTDIQISYRFEVTADCCSHFRRKPINLRFWAPLGA